MKFIDLTGIKFGNLTPVQYLGRRSSSGLWRCNCDCGSVGIFRTGNLRNGHTKSCGCLNEKKFRRGKALPPFVNDKTMRIQLTKGKYALVDADGYAELSKNKWCFSGGYAVRGIYVSGRVKIIRMHRLILNADADDFVDHVSMDTLDNRRSNLRIANKSGNGCNRRAQRNNTSGIKGVSQCSRDGNWKAQIRYGSKNHYLGRFKDKTMAANAYAEATRKFHGRFARTA